MACCARGAYPFRFHKKHRAYTISHAVHVVLTIQFALTTLQNLWIRIYARHNEKLFYRTGKWEHESSSAPHQEGPTYPIMIHNLRSKYHVTQSCHDSYCGVQAKPSHILKYITTLGARGRVTCEMSGCTAHRLCVRYHSQQTCQRSAVMAFKRDLSRSTCSNNIDHSLQAVLHDMKWDEKPRNHNLQMWYLYSE